ncbi:S28 family serine protease [Colwellia sp. E150_009]
MLFTPYLIACIAVFILPALSFASELNVSIEERSFTQPVNPLNPNGQQFQQQFFVLTPIGVKNDATVYFILGNETDSTKDKLTKIFKAYGSPTDMIFILSEHRGYGQSLTNTPQTVPEYVRVEHALSDYHRLITALQKTYTGKWIAGGYSYSGALVINFAHKYPRVVNAILASSAPINWPFIIPQYSNKVRENLGDEFVERIHQHISNIDIITPYDEGWQNRERYVVLTSLLTQRAEMQDIKTYISILSYLPTSMFSWFIEKLLPLEADDWIKKRTPKKLLVEQAKEGRFNWYTWKYQQCTQLGTFFSGKPFNYRFEEHVADCKATFGTMPEYLTAKPWNIASMISEIVIPQVVVSGGKDPWIELGVNPEHTYRNIDFFYVSEGFHCPDLDDVQLGRTILARLRSHIN